MRRKHAAYIWFIAPAVSFVLAFTIYPSLYGIYISLTDLHFGYVGSRFVGLDNYIRLVTWSRFLPVLRNTAVYVVAVVALQMSLGLLTALLLHKRVRGTPIARTIAILPWALPAVVIGLMFNRMVSGSKLGILNYLLSFLGMPAQAWLGDPTLAMVILIGALVWRGTALSVVLQLGGLQTIPDEVLEAARIDGAGSVTTLLFVTIPMLKPTLLVNLIMASAGTFNHVSIPLSLTGGGPQGATEVLSLAVYSQGFEVLNAGFAAAIATFMLALNIGLTIMYLRVLRERE
ncbi:MAG: sugar ABC transporter permease [Spirochaetales bacterium]|nr:sugar ABC transporter permease [Spirochaetales bacterium]